MSSSSSSSAALQAGGPPGSGLSSRLLPGFRSVLANLQLDIDCDRETERIFSLLSSNDAKLQKMEGEQEGRDSPSTH